MININRFFLTYYLCGLIFSNQCAESAEVFTAIENRRLSATEPRRGIYENGRIPDGALILTPNSKFRAWTYDPEKNLISTIEFETPAPGQSFTIPTPTVRLTDTRDSDNDGLSDEAEWIIGTDGSMSDTDEDGVDDGAEVRAGTDPLDGLNIRTGIILSREANGDAIDVAAFNNLVVLAQGERGISVFNVFNTMEATIIAQVDTPGDARAVAYPGGRLIAVGARTGGIAVIDLADGPNARVAHRILPDQFGGGEVRAVAAAADLGIAGTSTGHLVTFDMTEGILLDTHDIGSAIDDVIITADKIYTLQRDRLRVYPLAETINAQVGEAVATNTGGEGLTGRKRLFIGTQYAYASNGVGYDVFDITDSVNPTRVGDTMPGPERSFKNLVSDGTGIGIVTLGASPENGEELHNITLYHLSDPTVTNTQTEFFLTPGRALSVTLFNALAYVADQAAGLQVLNYRRQDIGTVAPTGNLTVMPVGDLIEGSIAAIRAEVTDDIVVRSVDFFANGQPIGTDGSFPFEVSYRVPQREAGFVEFTAIARDTANNAARLDAITRSVVPDTIPPTIVMADDLENAIITDHNDISAELTVSDNITVRSDEIAFELNGEVVPARRVSANIWVISSPGVGHYQFRVRVLDGANNAAFTPMITLKIRKQSVSREQSVFNFGPEPEELVQATSREITTFSEGPEPSVKKEAISREVSIENQE